MRIISGKLRGRKLDYPLELPMRPMSDRVREALFNVLGPVDDLEVLEAYAGTGVIGFEALSRGAESVDAIEKNREMASHIRANAEKLGLENYLLIERPVENWLIDAEETYDLIIADQPYDEFDPEIHQLLANHLKKDGTMVISHSKRVEPPELKGCKLATSRTYGVRALSFYKKA